MSFLSPWVCLLVLLLFALIQMYWLTGSKTPSYYYYPPLPLALPRPSPTLFLSSASSSLSYSGTGVSEPSDLQLRRVHLPRTRGWVRRAMGGGRGLVRGCHSTPAGRGLGRSPRAAQRTGQPGGGNICTRLEVEDLE